MLRLTRYNPGTLTFLLWFFLLGFIQNSNSAVISGEIRGAERSHLYLTYHHHFIRYAPEVVTAFVDENDFFFAEIPLTEAREVSFQFGTDFVSVFLMPEDTLYLNASADKLLSSMKFSGRSAAENRFLQRYRKEFVEGMNPFPDKYQELSPDEFREFARNRKSAVIRAFEAAEREGKFDKRFKTYIQNEILYSHSLTLLNYPIYHSYLNAKPFTPEKSYYDFLNTVAVNNEEALINYTFTEFLDKFIEHKVTEELYPKHSPSLFPEFVRQKYLMAEKLLNDKTLAHTQAFLLAQGMDGGAVKTVSDLYEEFILKDMVKEYTAVITDKFDIVTGLMPGSEAPDFTLEDADGKKVSLHEFRGKVVYLSFRAEWCRPCFDDLAFSQKLQDQFSEDEVVFLYISVDESRDAWARMVKKKAWKGVHLNDPGIHASTPKLYNVSALPEYFLINKKGKIAYGKTKRPSLKGVEEDIRKLLSGKLKQNR